MRPIVFLSLVALLAGGCASKNTPTVDGRQTLRPVALPDLSRAAEPIQAQLRERYASLVEKQKHLGTPAAELATEYGEMGKLLMAAEFPDQAEPALLNTQALAPGDMRWPYYLAHLYKTKGDVPNAAASFERALKLAPNDVPTLIGLGEAHLDQGRPEEGEALFTKALSLQPRSVAARYDLGRAALAKRDYTGAAENLEQALALDDKASSIHYPLALAYRGLGERSKAESHLQQRGIGEVQPDDPLMKELDELLDSAVNYHARGDAALDKRDWPAAVGYFRKGISLAPKLASLHHKLGTALFFTGDRRGALEEFQEAVRLAPNFPQALYSLGLMQESSGQHQQAVEYFSAVVKLQPDYVEARLHLAHALRRSGQLEASLSQYRKIVGTNSPVVEVVEARFGYAAALIRLKRYQEARDRLAEAMSLYPDEMAFALVAARLLAAAPDDRVRDGRRAMAITQMLVSRQPRNIELAETMGMTLAEVGRYDEAAMWQREAIAAAQQAGFRDLAVRLSENLKLYEAHRRCRTPWRADEPIEFYKTADAPAASR